MTYSKQKPLQKSTRYHQKTIESRSQEIEHKQNLVSKIFIEVTDYFIIFEIFDLCPAKEFEENVYV